MKKISFFFLLYLIATSARSQCTLQLDSVWLDSATSNCNHLFFKYKVSGGTPHSYWWDYGDGNACSCLKPKNVYNRNGTFLVRGKITDINGCTDSFDIQVNVNCSNPCDLSEIGIYSFDTLSYSCNEYEFNTITSDNAKKVRWDFGDGDTSSSKFVVHTYQKNGIFGIRLLIQDSIGCADTAEMTVKVDCPPVKPPCDFQITSIDTTQVGTCKFRLFNIMSNKTIVSTKWIYGDGDTLLNNSRFSGHTYKKDTGSFTMCVISMDSSGCKDTFCRPITVVCPKTDISVMELNMSSFKMFPNPVTDVLHINTFQNVTFCIYDGMMREIMKGDLPAGSNTVDMAGLNSGVYMISIQSVSGVLTGKVLKQ